MYRTGGLSMRGISSGEKYLIIMRPGRFEAMITFRGWMRGNPY